MEPPDPSKRPRQPSHSELKPILDQTPEDRVVEQRRFDRPKRTTLTDLPKAAPPERKPTLKGLSPAVPPPPARNPLQHRTVRADSPPPLVAASRRTDPPASPVPPRTSIRVPADEARATGQPGASLPPASQHPDRASLEAVRRRAEAAETELAELKRQKRVQAEAASPASFPPAVTPPAAPVIVHQGVSSETLEAYRKAQTKLMMAVAGLLVAIAAPCALWLTNAAVKAESDTKRSQVQVTEAVKTSESAKVQTSSTDKELAATKAELTKFKLYTIVLQRRQGVNIRLPDGVREEDLPKLDFEAPLRRPGEVKPGATLIVQTPP